MTLLLLCEYTFLLAMSAAFVMLRVEVLSPRIHSVNTP